VSIFQLALTFFIVANPIGNTPALLALLKDYEFHKQRRILIREGLISFIIAIFFLYFGEFFLSLLNVRDYAMTLAGGVLILIIALEMIFPSNKKSHLHSHQEPFIVPIATPLVSGAGVLSLIMLFGKETGDQFKVTIAVILAWVGIIGVMALAPYLQKLFGKRGLLALEQLMGMLLAIIGCTVFAKGLQMFIHGMAK